MFRSSRARPEVFWIIPATLCAALTIWGAVIGRGAWAVPALALLAYAGVRAIVSHLPPSAHEVAVCAFWLCVCLVMVKLPSGALPAFFWTLSALTYPVLLIWGVRIDWLSPSPVLAEIFAACAIVSVGGGLRGMASDPGGGVHRHLRRVGDPFSRMARRAQADRQADRPDCAALTL